MNPPPLNSVGHNMGDLVMKQGDDWHGGMNHAVKLHVTLLSNEWTVRMTQGLLKSTLKFFAVVMGVVGAPGEKFDFTNSDKKFSASA